MKTNDLLLVGAAGLAIYFLSKNSALGIFGGAGGGGVDYGSNQITGPAATTAPTATAEKPQTTSTTNQQTIIPAPAIVPGLGYVAQTPQGPISVFTGNPKTYNPIAEVQQKMGWNAIWNFGK